MRGPIGVKFCMVVSAKLSFIMPIQKFKGALQKNFIAHKHAKFVTISDDFEVWRRISPERIKVFKI